MRLQSLLCLLASAAACLGQQISEESQHDRIQPKLRADRDAFIENLISQMSVPDMVLQLHLMFGDNIVGPKSQNELYDFAMRFAPNASIGFIHDWYPLNKSYYNDVQRLNLENSKLKIPFMHNGECLHGVGSFNQSMFPQTIGLAATWDTEIVHKVGRAIGTEARSIGVHACLSPVLDLCKDPRWGRCQEDWGEDKILTSHMGVAYASGLSKNGSWSDPDAVVPVMKHFAAHGSPQGGINGAPSMVHGNREVQEDLLIPFKAVVDLGGVGGVMMAYSELDDIPSHVNPALYKALDDWGFKGFVTADDTGMKQLQTGHRVAGFPADAIAQWFNAGGMVQFYDYPLDVFLNATQELVKNGTVSTETLKTKTRRILGVKYDLGLFDSPYIQDNVDPYKIVADNAPLTLEAAQKSVILLENRNNTLPLDASRLEGQKIALIGPFGDILNYGDYSGQFGAFPVANSSTLRQGILQHIATSNKSTLSTSMGANSWLINAQYPIPGYHLSAGNRSTEGLLATYFADTNFSNPLVHITEVPTGTWGLYPPPGLPSNNFSVIWEGQFTAPVDGIVEGWLGVAVGPNTTARVYVDGKLHVEVPYNRTGSILSNIPPKTQNGDTTKPPPGSSSFTFQPGVVYKIRLEYQTWNTYQKIENESSLNSQVYLFWNLVDSKSPIDKSVALARSADVIVLAVGAGWNSDGEGGDRGTLSLPSNQAKLADAIFTLNKPVILVLQGGRPFAIPEYYSKAAAVIDAHFPGQSGGRAIADVLFGKLNPGGRVPVTVPKEVGQLPVFYNYKPTARSNVYVDIDPTPQYPFGYGLSYTSFQISNFQAHGKTGGANFTQGDIISFAADVKNNGTREGSYVVQVYLLQRVSQIVQPVKQLVAFQRVYFKAGEMRNVRMDLEVDRYLKILDRNYDWVLESGSYRFSLQEHGGIDAKSYGNATLNHV